MRTAYVLPTLSSGWRTHAKGFLTAMNRYTEQALFVAEEERENASNLFPLHEIHSLPVIHEARLRRENLKSIFHTWKTIRNLRDTEYDIVHSLEAYPTGLIGDRLAARWKTPHILTAHGTYGILAHKHPLDRLAYRAVLRRAKAVCPVSTGTAAMIDRYFPDVLSNTLVEPILNGIDTTNSVSRQLVLDRKFPSVPTVLTVGGVKRRKGIHVSLRAFAKLKKEVSTARYWIAGQLEDRAYHRQLMRMIEAESIRDVKFWGQVSEEKLRQLFQNSSLFLLSSQQIGLRFEGFGLVYLEAGAFALPVVATRVGGVPDAVLDGKTGFLLEPGDISGIARALFRLLTQRELAVKMGWSGRRWAETLTWARCAKRHHGIYQNILWNKRGQSNRDN